ncbi:DUF4064 domain-containing protein [Salinicoccus sp. Marseille-QA3877]
MARREYTQTIRPVRRIAEKIFGWLAWLGLLLVAGGLLFFSLVTVNDQAFIDQFTTQMEQSFEAQNVEGFTPEELTQTALNMLNSFWMIALYLILPLILGLFGLLTMKRRILSGFLMLLAGILSAPLVIGVVTGLIPLFFIIAAILLFVRKDEVIMDDGLDPMDRGGVRDRAEDPNAGPVNRERDLDGDRDFERRNQLERDREFERDRNAGVAAPLDDDVRTDRDYKDDGRRDARRDEDIEATRKFSKIDEKDYRDSEKRDNYVDGNIDSSDAVEPVTDDEFNRTHGMEVENERGSGISRERGGRKRERDNAPAFDAREEVDRKGKTYGYDNDASSERRQNVDRRNNDEL